MARGRWIAAMGGVLLLVMGLVSVSGGLRAARAVWAGADPVPSSGAAPREVRYLLQTRLADRSGAALQADRAVLIQRLRSSGIAPAHLILLPPRRIAVILPAGRARPFLTILLTETGAVTVQGSRAVVLPPGSTTARYPILARNTDITANATQMDAPAGRGAATLRVMIDAPVRHQHHCETRSKWTDPALRGPPRPAAQSGWRATWAVVSLRSLCAAMAEVR